MPRDPQKPLPSFIYVNATNLTSRSDNQFLTNGINITSTNASVHIELKPLSTTIAYLVGLKFGDNVVYNASFKQIDKFKIFCPKDDLVNSEFYSFFLNQTENKGFKGFVSIGIKELDSVEYNKYCRLKTINKNVLPEPKAANLSFTHDFSLKAWTSGCYFLDTSRGEWSSYGVEIMPDSNEFYAHCASSHLTEFAGGWLVLPASINFEYVWANASFEKNLNIYLTIIVILVLYVLVGVWARFMDIKDAKKIGIAVLDDNDPLDHYFYEVTVFTGAGIQAETESKVSLVVAGDEDETQVRLLQAKNRRSFRRDGIDTFIMSVPRCLGNLSYVRVGHDNSGRGSSASWYLKFVVVQDLQTSDKFLFLCERWLALEKDDGQIERLLSVAGEPQTSDFGLVLNKKAREGLMDGHLWLSIFTRPAYSAFSRLERVTCCLVLLFMTMLMNILYYEQDTSSSADGFKIGPLNLTPQQVRLNFLLFEKKLNKI